MLLPGGALSGWPAGAPLPVDVAWRINYTASVRRLVHGGVYAPLARLLTAAARAPGSGVEGAAGG